MWPCDGSSLFKSRTIAWSTSSLSTSGSAVRMSAKRRRSLQGMSGWAKWLARRAANSEPVGPPASRVAPAPRKRTQSPAVIFSTSCWCCNMPIVAPFTKRRSGDGVEPVAEDNTTRVPVRNATSRRGDKSRPEASSSWARVFLSPSRFRVSVVSLCRQGWCTGTARAHSHVYSARAGMTGRSQIRFLSYRELICRHGSWFPQRLGDLPRTTDAKSPPLSPPPAPIYQ